MWVDGIDGTERGSIRFVAKAKEAGQRSRRRIGLVTRFALTSAVVITVLGVLVAHTMHDDFRSQALSAAGRQAVALAATTAEPNIADAEFQNGLTPENLSALDRAYSGGGHGFFRVKIWSADGRIVYSNDRALIGTQFAGDHISRRWRATWVTSVSDPSAPENADERVTGNCSRLVPPADRVVPARGCLGSTCLTS